MSASIHASVVLLGESGVLIRGASGAGKSLLALALIERARLAGNFAALVADDRVWLEAVSGRLVARGAPALGGVCELRGVGLVEVPYEEAAAIRLVVDIADRGRAPPRIPEDADKYTTLCNIVRPRLRVDLSPGLEAGVLAVLFGLGRLDGSTWRKNGLDGKLFA
jgi:HPr kinase/phosphorylase